MRPVSDEGVLEVHRLDDLDAWEFYQVVDVEGDDPVLAIAMRPYPELEEVEYGIWRYDQDGEEPTFTGSVAHKRAEGSWSDGGREGALGAILSSHREDLAMDGRPLVYRLGAADDDGEPPSERSRGDHGERMNEGS